MAEKKERVQIELEKKYLKLEKKYIETVDKIAKLDKDFSSNATKKDADLKSKKQGLLKTDKEVIAKKNAQAKETIAKFNQGVKEQKSVIQKAQAAKKAEDLKIVSKLSKEEEKIAKALENQEAKFVKSKNDLTKNKESFLSKSKITIKSDADKTKESHDNFKLKLKEQKEKHQEKIASLGEKAKTLLAKIVAKSDKDVAKLNKEISSEEKATSKAIKDLNPIVASKLESFEKELKAFEEVYNEKTSVINSTLKEKNDRHQKFLDKAIEDNDPRSQKLHRKEMADLTKNANAELKILKSDFSKNRASLDMKIKEIKTQNLIDVKVYNIALAKFVEEKKFEIKSSESEKTLEISKAELSHKQSVKDEEDKNNKFISNINLKKEALDNDKNLLVLREETSKVQNKLGYDNDLKSLDFQNKEYQAKKLNEKELAILDSNIDKSKALTKEEVIVAKAQSEIAVSEHRIEKDKLLIEEDQLKELHENDFEKQKDLNHNNESFNKLQTEFSEKRFESLIAYETLEIENRLGLSIAMIDKQLAYAKADCDVILKKIDSHFDEEKALFDKEIKKIAGDLLAEKEKVSADENSAIEKIKKQIEELDVKADKKKIKLLKKEIQVKEMGLNQKLLGLEKTISLKTTLYQKGIQEASSRRQDTIDDSNSLLDVIIDNLNVTKESIEQIAKKELVSLKEKSNVMKASVIKFNTYSKERKELQQVQNDQYKAFRLNDENIIIANAKQVFESVKFNLTDELDKLVQTFDKELEVKLAGFKQQETESKLKLENTNSTLSSESTAAKSETGKLYNSEHVSYKLKVKKNDEEFAMKNTAIKKSLLEKENTYKAEISVLEKQVVEANKQFEVSKKNFLKEKNDNTSKQLSEIEANSKLEIKNL